MSPWLCPVSNGLRLRNEDHAFFAIFSGENRVIVGAILKTPVKKTNEEVPEPGYSAGTSMAEFT